MSGSIPEKWSSKRLKKGTAGSRWRIESELAPVPAMQRRLEEKYGGRIPGKLFLKKDSHLPIVGSVKARGGIYEVLKYAEDLALTHGMLKKTDSYEKLAEPECRAFFGKYTIQAGSTGNLGMSIGVMSAALGFHCIIHMSSDARQWKKDLLRSHGATVMEYGGDYGEAVKEGREKSERDPASYFVDDENSRSLFLGYAVAALRLRKQLEERNVKTDDDHPLFVYIPCGVGGAPGGISFGLKQLFGDTVHCFFAEPVQAPCMALGMITGLHSKICVQDIGLTGQTHADGLAVGRPSAFVGRVMEPLLSGEFTVRDARLYEYMRDCLETEKIFLEPSACAAFQGPVRLCSDKAAAAYLEENGLKEKMEQASHIVWATGGSLVPEEIRKEYRETFL
ncbi:MAG TPA: D-serine ammonia-lyase [Candidatus Blautia excrementipullorum]|nr:D-serine ammonia-lyase [Candidatus Blautia excrementipullorum]